MSENSGSTLGRAVAIPNHSFEVDPELLGPLVDDFEPNGFGYEQDFRAAVEIDDDAKLRATAEAVARTSERIMMITEFGRELGSLEELEQAGDLDVFTPSYASDPTFLRGDVAVFSDWKGETPKEAADACLAVLVQELQAAGVERAKIKPATYSS